MRFPPPEFSISVIAPKQKLPFPTFWLPLASLGLGLTSLQTLGLHAFLPMEKNHLSCTGTHGENWCFSSRIPICRGFSQTETARTVISVWPLPLVAAVHEAMKHGGFMDSFLWRPWGNCGAPWRTLETIVTCGVF